MSGTGQGDSAKNVFESGALSKFSTTEFNFIYKNRTDSRANSAPNGSNIGVSSPLSSSPNDQPFKYVKPTYDSSGKITGYSIDPSATAALGLKSNNLDTQFTAAIVDLAKKGQISDREAIFAIRCRNDMADGVINRTGGESSYGSDVPSGPDRNTSFYGSDVSKQLERNNKARQVIGISNAHDIEKQKGLKDGTIIETVDSNGKTRYVREDKTQPQTAPDRYQIFVPNYGDIFDFKDQEDAAKTLEEIDFMASAKNSRSPDEKNSRSNTNGPKLNLHYKIDYKDNPDGSITYENERDSKVGQNESANNSSIRGDLQGSLYAAFDLDGIINDQMIKWFIDPISGAPKSASLVVGALDKYIASKNTSPNSPAGLFISNYRSHLHGSVDNIIKGLDQGIIAIKVYKKFAKALSSGKVDELGTWLNPATSPVMPILYYFIGKNIKSFLLKKAAQSAGLLALTGPVVTGIIMSVDSVITIADLYFEYRQNIGDRYERLRDEAERNGWLSGPYIQTGGLVRIPVMGDPTRNRKIPIGIQKDNQGNIIYEKIKIKDQSTGKEVETNLEILVPDPLYPNDRTKDRKVPKYIYPKSPNVRPGIIPFRPSSQLIQSKETIGFRIDGDLTMNSYNDFDENRVTGYISSYRNTFIAAERSSDFSDKSKTNEQNGLRDNISPIEERKPAPPTTPEILRSSEIDVLSQGNGTILNILMGTDLSFEDAITLYNTIVLGLSWAGPGEFSPASSNTSGVINTRGLPETSPVKILNGNVDDPVAGYDSYGNPNSG